MDAHFTQLRPDLAIHQSEIFHTNTGILKTQSGYLLVDPAFTQADLERITAFMGPSKVLAGFSTHAHYDHLFWSALFGDETSRYCSEGTLGYITLHQQEILDELSAFGNALNNINRQYFQQHLLHLTHLSNGLNNLNDILVEVVDIPGHMSGQSAFLFPEFQVLFAADTLSDIEPPSIEGSRQSLLEYLESLDKLEGLIQQAEWIIPGHGAHASPTEAKRRLEQDRRYLQALLALGTQEFAGNIEVLGRNFLVQIEETRAETPDGWQMHLQNLDFVRSWL